jgi:hypothetical protein
LRGGRGRKRSGSHKLLQIHLILGELSLLFCQLLVDLIRKNVK